LGSVHPGGFEGLFQVASQGADEEKVATLAAKHTTQTLPIIMVYVAAPVGTGLVASLARPGGNLTGVSDMATDLSAKRLELLNEAILTLSRMAILWNAADPGMVLRFREIEAAARVLGVTLHSHQVRSPQDFEPAFAAIARERPDALFVVAEALTLAHMPPSRCPGRSVAVEIERPRLYRNKKPFHRACGQYFDVTDRALHFHTFGLYFPCPDCGGEIRGCEVMRLRARIG
jgi:hypothetical protein